MSRTEIIPDSEVIRILTQERDELRKELDKMRGGPHVRPPKVLAEILALHARSGLGLILNRHNYISAQELDKFCEYVIRSPYLEHRDMEGRT